MKPISSSEPVIVILLPMVWSVRNVVYSGVLEHLAKAGMKIYLLMRECSNDLRTPEFVDFASATGYEPLVAATISKRRIKGRALLAEVIHDAHSRRNNIASYQIYKRWNMRHYTAKQRRRTRLVGVLGRLIKLPVIFELMCRLHSKLLQSEYDISAIQTQLRSLKPDLIVSTANVEPLFERTYLIAAQELKIPVMTSILSFDNLTTKSAHLNYQRYCHYLVWNRRMEEQLLQFFPKVKPEQITITGTPQFDFHQRADFAWSREKTLQSLGLPFDAHYFLYATSTAYLAPAEPELVASLAARMKADPSLKDYWLVVRYHPKEPEERWRCILDVSDHVGLSYPWTTDRDLSADYWTFSTPQDQARFVSSLKHSEACLNIASTTALDAAILDRPVIGIRFDREPDAPSDILYEEYDATHYRPLVESGGLRVAHNWSELLGLMKNAIEYPERDRQARARMVEQECGQVDGQSAKRVAQTLIRLLSDHQ